MFLFQYQFSFRFVCFFSVSVCARGCMCETKKHLPLIAVLHSVADLVLGLKQEVLEFRAAGPADSQLVLQFANTVHLHVGWRVGGNCGSESKQIFPCFV